jgi:arsenate reductase
MISLYGIPNCDTVKKARSWLDTHGLAYQFHDFKKAGVPAQLDAWATQLGWDTVLNRKGTTWRKLDAAQQAAVHDTASACALMRAHPSAIKRPVVEWNDGSVTVGFNAEAWAARHP